MTDLALVTCAEHPQGTRYDAGLVEALAVAGIDAQWVCWDDTSVDWTRLGGALLRSPWDYTERADAFLDWADHVDRATRLWNPAAVVRRNAHKRYLAELADAGLPAVPTVVASRGAPVAVREVARERGWPAVVVKPAVAVGGRATKWFPADRFGAAQLHLETLVAGEDVLVQPHLGRVAAAGETSVVVLDGVPSHTLRKRAGEGGFLIHEHHGGSTEVVEATAEQLDVASRVLGGIDGDLVYARVDLIDGDDGPLAVELELIEPSLWLDLVPAAAGRLARAVAARL